MIPAKRLILKEDQCKERKDQKGYNFLYYFQLNQREGTSILMKPYTIGRHLKRILDQRNTPTQQNDSSQRQAIEPFLAFET